MCATVSIPLLVNMLSKRSLFWSSSLSRPSLSSLNFYSSLIIPQFIAISRIFWLFRSGLLLLNRFFHLNLGLFFFYFNLLYFFLLLFLFFHDELLFYGNLLFYLFFRGRFFFKNIFTMISLFLGWRRRIFLFRFLFYSLLISWIISFLLFYWLNLYRWLFLFRWSRLWYHNLLLMTRNTSISHMSKSFRLTWLIKLLT